MSKQRVYQSIITRFHGPTDRRGSRISATSTNGDRIYRAKQHDLDPETDHREVALALADFLGWPKSRMVTGGLKDGYVHIFCDE